MAAGIELVALLTEIWAASVAVFSQYLSAPDVVLSCGVEWAELGCSQWERNHCVLLHVLTVSAAAPPRPHPGPSGCLCIVR